ncbi:MAG: SMP-30/gluconolactonase/LRE family protein, partial [Chthoniobacteraceae bacterium]
IFVSDLKANRVWKIGSDGKPTDFLAEGVSGLKWAPDGKLYGCQGAKKRIISIDPKTRAVAVVATDVEPNDLVITHRGHLYFTETSRQQVTMVDLASGRKCVVDRGIGAPNGITLSPDQGTLVVSDYRGRNVWSFRVDSDGALSARSPYMTMRCPADPKAALVENQPPTEMVASGGDGMASDTDGRYYVATKLGVQVFDPTGRPCGLLGLPPGVKAITSCALAGPDLSYLYVTQGDAVYRRKVQAHGVRYHHHPENQTAAAR